MPTAVCPAATGLLTTADAATKKPPACALSAEADQYHHCAELLRWAGCDIAKQSQPEAWGGVAVDNVRPAVARRGVR